ncbi:hypothetical protein DFJ77DRAFT_320821 [Powellomyces hirtus]|nr:hypothetical protein DFJ77DRAFT_320821 [Powellomyces hirtus]
MSVAPLSPIVSCNHQGPIKLPRRQRRSSSLRNQPRLVLQPPLFGMAVSKSAKQSSQPQDSTLRMDLNTLLNLPFSHTPPAIRIFASAPHKNPGRSFPQLRTSLNASGSRHDPRIFITGSRPPKPNRIMKKACSNNLAAKAKRQRVKQPGHQQRQHPAEKSLVNGRFRPSCTFTRKGDFYRPSPLQTRPVISSAANESEASDVIPPCATDATASRVESSNPTDGRDPEPGLSEQDFDVMLDDVFADMALCGNGDEEDAVEEDYDDSDYCTPPLSQWEYPEAAYTADRRKFSNTPWLSDRPPTLGPMIPCHESNRSRETEGKCYER